jgi:alpha-galactosidase
MCGSLGIGGHLKRWGVEKRTEAARWIEVYKQIRPIVQFGDQYRLRSPNDDPFSAVLYMSKDRTEGVLFAFRTHMPEPVFLPPVYPKGLDPDSLYQVEGFSDLRSGKAWMEAGLRLEPKDFQSSLRRIRKISD